MKSDRLSLLIQIRQGYARLPLTISSLFTVRIDRKLRSLHRYRSMAPDLIDLPIDEEDIDKESAHG